MLVLSRDRNEEVVVIDTETGELILTTTVVDIRADKVRTGYTADRRYAIHRREVWEAIQRERASLPPVIEGQHPGIVA